MSDTENTAALSILGQLEQALSGLGLSTLRQPPNADHAYEQLLVSIDDPPPAPGEESTFVFQLFFASDALAAQNPEAGEGAAILQFLLNLPLDASEDAGRLLDLYQLFSVFNRILPIGAFELSESHQAYLRYSLLAEHKAHLTVGQLVEVLEILSFFTLRMAPAMAALVYGGKSLEQAVAEAEQSLAAAFAPTH